MPTWRRFGVRRRDRMTEAIRAGHEGAAPAYTDPVLRAESKAAYAALRKYAEALMPGAVDEGSGDTLDAVIDAWTQQWLAQADQDHIAARALLERRLGASTQAEVLEQRLLRADEFHVELAETALEQARDKLMRSED